jgi:hypothetical protein
MGLGPGGSGGTRSGRWREFDSLISRDPGAGQARNLRLKKDFDWEFSIGEHVHKDVMKLPYMIGWRAKRCL